MKTKKTHLPEGDPRTCSVVANDDCKAPANGHSSTRATCFACGEAVCTARGCSRIIQWWGYGRKRVCDNYSTNHSTKMAAQT